MSEWSETVLGDIGSVQSGFAFKSRDWVDHGIPVLKIQNVRNGRVDLEGCSFVSPEVAAAADRYRLRRGDVLVTMSGEIGSIGIVRSDDLLLLNQRVGRVQVAGDDAVLLRYVGYALQNPDLKAKMEVAAYGVAQPNISPKLLATMPIHLPCADTRERITAVLDSLDDLIENNRRRVEVLEEMARAIYQEWFVHFRYPGHEAVPLVDSALGAIPEGWVVVRLGDVLELKYGKALKKADRRGGSVAVVGSSGVVGWHDVELVSGPSVAVGRKGNVGSITWIDHSAWPIDTTYYVATDLPLRYVVEQLRRTEFLNSHAAVPGLSREQAYSRPFLRPQELVMHQFSQLSDDLFSESAALTGHTEALTTLRDLLLPKLVTGQIDVSSLDLDSLVGEMLG